LKLWLFTDKQIDAIEESGEVQFYFKILSPATGTVTKRNISQGDHVMEGMSMFQIIDLRHLWVEFDAYESDIPWVNLGSKVNITLKSIPGKVFKSKITFIDPVLNGATRTTIIRTELDNKNGKLRPGMFAQATIQSMLTNKGDVLMVPKSAVLWTGKKSVVYIKEDHGKTYAFHFREITLGEDTGTHYVVVDGLMAGESVVTNGAFKIDAAAQLKGSPSMMNPSGGEQSLGGMAGMDMGGDGDKKEEKKVKKEAPKKQSSMDVDAKFKTQFSAVVTSYIALKDAFVNTNVKDAVSKSKAVKAQMAKVDMGLLKGDAHLMWMDMMKPINSNLDKIIASSDVETQRLAFADLTDGIYKTVKMFKVTGINVYYQFCPMARDGKGANWLSLTSDIKNPYFGDAMLTCGETKEKIK
jgi:Cu(I)/Ag(I) efflux system membrane fusion protein